MKIRVSLRIKIKESKSRNQRQQSGWEGIANKRKGSNKPIR